MRRSGDGAVQRLGRLRALRGSSSTALHSDDEPVLDGAEFPAAELAFTLLIQRIAAIAAEGWLAPTVEVAAAHVGVCECCIPASRHSSATQGGATHFCGS